VACDSQATRTRAATVYVAIRSHGGGQTCHSRQAAAQALEAADIRVPTLLVYGDRGDIVSADSVDELRSLIPHAQVVDILVPAT
jgi:pimeloyl-ACP methyl ester carboxylesterase